MNHEERINSWLIRKVSLGVTAHQQAQFHTCPTFSRSPQQFLIYKDIIQVSQSVTKQPHIAINFKVAIIPFI
jgi:hypothetical protein